MQSVFNTKDDAVSGDDDVKLIVDDGKLVFGRSATNECSASWITEITSFSSSEEDDEDVVDKEKEGATNSPQSPDHVNTDTDHSSMPIIDSDQNGHRPPLMYDSSGGGGEGGDKTIINETVDVVKKDTRDNIIQLGSISTSTTVSSSSRMSLRRRSVPSKLQTLKLKKFKSRSGSGSGDGVSCKMMCTRGRGGRLIRNLGFKGCTEVDQDGIDADLDHGLWLNSVNRVSSFEPDELEHVDRSVGTAAGESPILSLLNNYRNSSQLLIDANVDGPRPRANSLDVAIQKSRASLSDSATVSSVDDISSKEKVSSAPVPTVRYTSSDKSASKEVPKRSSVNLHNAGDHYPKKESPFLDRNFMKQMFHRRRKLSDVSTKTSETELIGKASPLHYLSKTPVPHLNGTLKKVKTASSRKKQPIIAANGSVPSTDLSAAVAGDKLKDTHKSTVISNRDCSRKEVKDFIEGSIKVSEIVSLARHRKPSPMPLLAPQRQFTPASTRAILPKLQPIMMRPPILFVNFGKQQHQRALKPASAKPSAVCDTSAIVASSARSDSTKPSNLKVVSKPVSVESPLEERQPAGVATPSSMLPSAPQPLLFVKAVRKYNHTPSRAADASSAAAHTPVTTILSPPQPKSEDETKVDATQMNKHCLNNLKPLSRPSDQGGAVVKTVHMLASKKPEKMLRPIRPAPTPPPKASPSPTNTCKVDKESTTTMTAAALDDVVDQDGLALIMPRATKRKAMQKISAIVSRKKKIVRVKLQAATTNKRKRSNENEVSEDSEASSRLPPTVVAAAAAADVHHVDDRNSTTENDDCPGLPPPPRLTPCSMSRTEELQRKNLLDKLQTSALPSISHLQCRVNIPLLERYPLASRRANSPPPLAPPSSPSAALSLPLDPFTPSSSSGSPTDEPVAQPPPTAATTTPMSLEQQVEKRPIGRPRIHRPPNVAKATRFSRNGRRIGRPPIRMDSVRERDVPASVETDVSPTSMVDQELRRLRLQSPTIAGLKLPGFGSLKAVGHNMTCAVDQPQRSSIRQTECAFRYREISLRKHDNFTQIVLTTTTRVKNGLNYQVLRELKMALDAARTDKNCHVVLLNGTGSVFCSGIDLISLVKDVENTSIAKELATALREFSRAVMSFPKTLVAAVNGAAVGLGVTMLPLFDIVYASDKATFYTPYVKLGHIPEGGATFSLPLAMGFARANGMLMGGRRITATEAFECGLVTQVLWPSAFMEGVIPQVQALAKQSLQTMGSAKALIRYHSVRELEVTLDIECRILAEQWGSSECIQSIREFLDKEEVV